jgi:hypothetical protein
MKISSRMRRPLSREQDVAVLGAMAPVIPKRNGRSHGVPYQTWLLVFALAIIAAQTYMLFTRPQFAVVEPCYIHDDATGVALPRISLLPPRQARTGR